MRTPKYQFFSIDEYQQRMNNLRSRMNQRGLDAVLINTPENLYYLTGYQTPGYYWYQALIVPIDQDPVFITRSSENTNVEALTWVENSRPYDDNDDWIAKTKDILIDLKLDKKVVGFESTSWFLTSRDYISLSEKLSEMKLEDCSGIVEQGRMIKSTQEIEYIRHAAQAAGAAMKAAINATAVGVTENEIAAEAHRAQILAGGEYTGLPIFVASGIRSEMTHATWYRRRLENNETIVFEIPGCINRYHAAMFRAVYVGDPPESGILATEVGIETLQKAKEFIKPGVTAGQVHELIQNNLVARLGVKKNTGRVGYSIGIAFSPDWGEGQIISFFMGDQRPLQAGMTFHLLPSTKVPGIGTFTTSDTILVTKNGCETLTDVDRKLYVR